MVAGAFVATVSSASEDGAAQSVNNEASIAVQTSWTSGYMALGGGLIKAVPKKHAHADAHERVDTAAAPHHRVRHKRKVHAARRLYDPQASVTLVSKALDH